MKSQLLKVSTGPAHSFSVRNDCVPQFNNRWHHHEEVELIHFKNGAGTQFIGDSIKHFGNDNIVLVGKQLPHHWRFDESNKAVDVRVVHFCEDFWGEGFLQLLENERLKTVFQNARRGIEVTGEHKKTVAALLEKLLTAEGTERIILLIEILKQIAECDQCLLSSQTFKHITNDMCNERINAIYEYSMANFKNKIQLDEIASIANISPSSFCRYFKAQTRKTYTWFLIELKVEYACKLLIENKVNLKQLCYESGFHNFASFHKYFKLITGKTPLKYQREFI
jgi:AraC-like DNA-binding protein